MNFRLYRPPDISSVVELLNLCFPGRQINQSSFTWKHFDSFFSKQTLAYVAEDKHQIVCFVCFVPIGISGVRSQKFYSCAVQATHPQYRRRGLTKILTQMVESRLPSTQSYLGFSNDQGIQIDLYSRTINYSIVGQLSTQYLLPSLTPSRFNFQLVETPDTFYNLSAFFQIKLSPAYVRWRFCENPKCQYFFYSIQNKGKNIGTIICREKFLGVELTQVNLCVDDSRIWSRVISDFARFELTKGKIVTSISYLDNNFWSQIFTHNFLNKKIKIYLTIKSSESSYFDKNKWLVQGGDIQ